MSNVVLQLEPATITEWSNARTEPLWLTEQRRAAWQHFQVTPPPRKTDEAWKYTDLERLAGWDRATWGTTTAARYDFTLPESLAAPGLLWCDLATALRDHPDLVRPYLTLNEPATNVIRRRFSGINGSLYGGQRYLWQQEALWDGGTFLYVPAGLQVTIPLHTTVTATAAGTALFPRQIIVVEAGASVVVVDEYTSDGALNESHGGSAHARVELYVGEGARLDYINLQRWHGGMRHLLQQHATVGRDAHVTSTTITAGGRIAKSVIESELTAPGADSLLFGLTLGEGKQHIDYHTLQTHIAPHTTSDLLFKTALKDTAHAVFTGLIRMTTAAQQSNAYQSNRNLLLSRGATANAIPQLEIEANDVRCSHGATIGPIDEDQCYYLMSRGLPRPVIEQLIVAGFFEDLVARIPSAPAADIVRNAIAHRQGRNNMEGSVGEG